MMAAACGGSAEVRGNIPGKVTTEQMDWAAFLSRHDMHWNKLTEDPAGRSADGQLRTGYYAGAIMGNGLLGTNFYKLKDNVYRLNVGRSDVTEARSPYDLFNSARLPIGYFTLQTKGEVAAESMTLSLYDAITRGTFQTEKGQIDFKTYVHANEDYIVFESETDGGEVDYVWDFVPQEAISPRYCFNGTAPKDYLNRDGKSNPAPERQTRDGVNLLVQKLVTDTTFQTVARVYVVGWKEVREGNKRRIVATVSQEKREQDAVASAVRTVQSGLKQSSGKLEDEHTEWWHDFYRKAAFVTFPDKGFESFYWAQYYKFASTARPGKPVVDLQGYGRRGTPRGLPFG